MEGGKDRIILILAILTVIFFIVTVNSCNNASHARAVLNKEVALRLELEEKISKFAQEKTAAEENIKALKQELEKEKATHEVTKKALLQEQLVSQSLKEELEKIANLKEGLTGGEPPKLTE